MKPAAAEVIKEEKDEINNAVEMMEEIGYNTQLEAELATVAQLHQALRPLS